MNLIISKPKHVQALLSQFSQAEYQSLYILSDFDRTLTYGTVNGIETPSIISLLRDGNHLTSDYALKAQKLFDQYHPLELDPKLPLDEKRKQMKKWWETHNQLLIESGLKKADLEDIVRSRRIKFRKGTRIFFDFLHKHNIPLVIISASGCGDAIRLLFQQINKDYPNFHYITNQFNWDSSGKALSTKGPIIHSFNKNETMIAKITAIDAALANRKNVILLGDSLGDIGMLATADKKNAIKIGFLNSNQDQLKAEYKKQFDVIVEGDGNFRQLNRLLFGIIPNP